MKLLKFSMLVFVLCIVTNSVNAQGITAIISYCGYENTLGCGCDAGTRVPFADGENSWCVFWDRNANGPDASDQLVPIGTDEGQASQNCWTFNGAEVCGIAGNFAGDPGLSILVPHSTDPWLYYVKAPGATCCWVSDTFRLMIGLQDVVLEDGDFSCIDTPCPIGEVPDPVTNVTVSDDQFCLDVNVSWQHSGENVSGFRLTIFDEETSEWIFQTQTSDTIRSALLPVCRDGEVQVGVRAVNGSQAADRVAGVGRTYLRHFDPVDPIDYLGGSDILLRLVRPGAGQACNAFLNFDLYCGGEFVQHLCGVTSADSVGILEIPCTLPSETPNPSCYIVMRDSSDSQSLGGCVLTDTLFDIMVSADDYPSLVREFSLLQNYPNPFNPNTAIEFSVPAEGVVDLSVFNLNGQKVATLISGNVSAGSHRVDWNGTAAATGVYFYRLQMGTQVMTRKMLLLK